MIHNNSVRKKIVSLRKTKGYNQEDMAVKLHLTESQYRRKEKGQTPLSVACLQKIATLFAVPLSYFFEEDEYFGEKNCSNCLVYKEQMNDLKNDKIRLQQRVDDLKLGRLS